MRLLIAAGLVGLSLGWPTAAASAAAGPCSSQACVTVQLPGGSSQTVTAAELDAASDVHNTIYQVRAVPNGTTSDLVVSQGLSVDGLLQLVGEPRAAVSFVAVQGPGGAWTSVLKPPDVASPNDFEDSLQPVVYTNGSDDEVSYDRPLRSDDDTNAADHAQTTTNGSMTIEVHSGPLLDVTTRADRTHVQPGAPVSLSSDVVSHGTDNDRPLTYDWSFDDGQHSADPAPGHTYARTGVYTVRLTVTGGDDSAGQAEPLAVTVGNPTAAHPCRINCGSGGPGGGGSGGGRGGASPGGHVGAQHHHSSSSPSPNQRSPGRGTPGTGGGQTTASGPIVPGGGIVLPQVPSGGQSTLSLPQAGAPTVAPDQAPVVSGQVLSGDTTAIDPKTGDPLAAGSSGVRATVTSTSMAGWVAELGGGTAGVVLLLAFGAGRESGWSARRIIAVFRR